MNKSRQSMFCKGRGGLTANAVGSKRINKSDPFILLTNKGKACLARAGAVCP